MAGAIRIAILADSSRARRELSKFSKSTSGLGSSLKRSSKVGALALASVSAAAVAFTVKAGAGYVSSLNKIQALTDASDSTMKAAAKTLEANAGLYAKMGQTTGDAAGGVVELTKAGVSLRDSLKAVNGTMVLAKAGELSVADASTLVANSLNTFGLKAKDAGKIANQLANAANISSADVSDLAESFKFVAPVAASSGLKMGQVSAVLAELSNSGIKATNAGTGLRKFLLSLQAPAGAAGKMIDSLGIKIFDSKGKMLPFQKVVANVGKGLDGLSDEKRAKALRTIFGLTGVTTAQIILKGGVKGLDQYRKGVNRAGAAQKLANAQSKGLAGTFSILKATTTSTAQSLYRNLSPIADKVLRPLAVSLSKVAPLLGPKLAAGAEKIGGLFSGLSRGGAGAAGLFSQLAKTGTALKAFGAGLLPTLKSLGTQLKGTLGPGLQQIGKVVSTQFLPAFRNILPVLLPVAKFLLKLFGGAVIGALKGGIKVIVGLVTTISGVFNLISDLVHGRWGKIWGDLKQILSGALTAVLGAIQVWWNVGILGLFKRAGLKLLLSWRGLWSDAEKGTKGLISRMFSNIGKLFEAGVKGIGKLLLSGIKGYLGIWRRLFTVYLDIAKTGWKVLRSAFGGAVAALRSVVSHWLSSQKALFGDAWGALKGIVVKAWGAVRGAVSDGIGKVMGLVKDLPGKILGSLSRLPGKLKSLFGGVWQGLAAGLKDALNAVLHLPLTIPKINTHIPGVGTVGGQTLIPALAKGGIVTKPTLALIGEAGPEAVIPLSDHERAGNVYNINVQAAPHERISETIPRALSILELTYGG